MMNDMDRIIDECNEKPLLLVELPGGGTASSGARKIYAEYMKHERLKKMAFFGMQTSSRVVMSFILRAAGATNAKFFATEEEALAWLKE